LVVARSNKKFVGDKPVSERKNILYKGLGQSIPENNGLNFAVLRGYDTTYSGNPNNAISAERHGKIGSDTVLVSALQARNNARVVISGSLLFFSDKFFVGSSDNQYLTNELSKWVFKERGILSASNLTHHLVGEKVAPNIYTIKEKIEVSLSIKELKGDKWVPFVSDKVQLEFSMLDPYVRLFLKSDQSGRYSASFTVPDVYGVFSFKVDYVQLGYTFISLKDVFPVRPFWHNEYPRFLTMANPYYLSSISMLAGVFVLAFFLIFSSNK